MGFCGPRSTMRIRDGQQFVELANSNRLERFRDEQAGAAVNPSFQHQWTGYTG